MSEFDLPRRLTAEALGTAILVATVVGSGIMAETLTKDVALALLGNTLPTGAILVVLISILGIPYLVAEAGFYVFGLLILAAVIAMPLAIGFGFGGLRWAERHPEGQSYRGRAIWGLVFGFLAWLRLRSRTG